MAGDNVMVISTWYPTLSWRENAVGRTIRLRERK